MLEVEGNGWNFQAFTLRLVCLESAKLSLGKTSRSSLESSITAISLFLSVGSVEKVFGVDSAVWPWYDGDFFGFFAGFDCVADEHLFLAVALPCLLVGNALTGFASGLFLLVARGTVVACR